MVRYVLSRLALSVTTVIGILLVVFILMRVIPGDPIHLIAGFDVGPEEKENIRHQLGLDQPIHTQFFIYARDMVTGNFGESLRTYRPVIDEIRPAIANTLILVSLTLLVTSLSGLTIGLIAAKRPDSTFDHLVTVLTTLGMATPSFFLAILLILVFSVRLGWLPSIGIGNASNLILPTVTLTLSLMALVTRMTRASILEVLGSDYIQAARAKGLGSSSILLRQALPNALIPIITVVGLQASNLLGGSTIIVETVFAYPGIGRLLVDSITARDYPLVQVCIIFVAMATVATNLLTDMFYYVIDPRIQVE